jgi:hypothetical protein
MSFRVTGSSLSIQADVNPCLSECRAHILRFRPLPCIWLTMLPLRTVRVVCTVQRFSRLPGTYNLLNVNQGSFRNDLDLRVSCNLLPICFLRVSFSRSPLWLDSQMSTFSVLCHENRICLNLLPICSNVVSS